MSAATEDGGKPHAYSLPHGGQEEDGRLGTQHDALFALMHGKVTHAPVEKPLSILDIGCGTGIVTRALASAFPTASVTGIDLYLGQNRDEGNMKFVQGAFLDLIKQGKLLEHQFDYIFSRMLVMGVADWPAHCEGVDYLLKPGGWVEMQDLSWHGYDINGNSIHGRFPSRVAIVDAAIATGVDPYAGEHIPEYLEPLGYVNTSYTAYPWALKEWPEHPEATLIAKHNQSKRMDDARTYLIDKLVGGTGKYSAEELEELKIQDRKVNFMVNVGDHGIFGVTYAQKPGNAIQESKRP